MKKKYILIDPNDETGNDDGIRDEQEMTAEEAIGINEMNYQFKSDLRWVEKYPSHRSPGITHLD